MVFKSTKGWMGENVSNDFILEVKGNKEMGSVPESKTRDPRDPSDARELATKIAQHHLADGEPFLNSQSSHTVKRSNVSTNHAGYAQRLSGGLIGQCTVTERGSLSKIWEYETTGPDVTVECTIEPGMLNERKARVEMNRGSVPGGIKP